LRLVPTAPAAQLAILLTVGLAARFLALLAVARLPWFSLPDADSALYDDMAGAFARGDWLIGTDPLRSSTYPFFLGIVYRIFGVTAWAPRVVQMVLGLLLVGLTWDTARRLMGTGSAVLAGGVVALFGPALFYEAQLLSDAPAAALAALALWMMVRSTVQGEGRVAYWGLTGLATGAVVLLRPNAILLAIPLAAAAAWSGAANPPYRRVVAAAIGFLIGVSPVAARNLLATGHATVVPVYGGINLYVGNGPDATGVFNVPVDVGRAAGPQEQFTAFRAAAARAEGHPLDAAATDRYWIRRTLAYIADDPMRWVTLMLWKLRLFWNGRSISDIEHYEFTRDLVPVLALPLVQWWALMPLALVGTVLAFRNRGASAIVGIFNLTWCCSVVIFFVADRYRLPSLSGLAIAAVLAVSQITAMWRQGSRVGQAALGSLLAAALLIAWPVGVVDNSAAMWLRLGVGYERLGQIEEARAAFGHAADLAPDDPQPRRALEQLRDRRAQDPRHSGLPTR